MKKLFVLFVSFTALSLNSCSKKDASIANPIETVFLPKKIINIESSGSNTTSDTTTITYNGNKIATYTNSDDDKLIFTYTGDLITKVDEYSGATLTNQSIYNYVNNKLITETTIRNYVNTTTGVTTVSKNKAVYTYNTDGTIIIENYIVDNTTGVETKNNNISVVKTLANGNLVKVSASTTNTYSFGTENITNIYTFLNTLEYDNKNNPYKNILGLSQVFLNKEFSMNNCTKETSLTKYTTNGVTETPPLDSIDYIYTYNSDNYPTEEKYSSQYFNSNNVAAIKTHITKYFYE